MVRLSLMSAPCFPAFRPPGPQEKKLRTNERLFLFGSTVLVMSAGYFLQPLIDHNFFGNGFGPLRAILPDWRAAATSALLPGSLTAYAVISADNGRAKWRRGGVTSVLALTGFDFLAVLQGSTSFRGLLFCLACNLVGGPAGVFLVIFLHAQLRPILFAPGKGPAARGQSSSL